MPSTSRASSSACSRSGEATGIDKPRVARIAARGFSAAVQCRHAPPPPTHVHALDRHAALAADRSGVRGVGVVVFVGRALGTLHRRLFRGIRILLPAASHGSGGFHTTREGAAVPTGRQAWPSGDGFALPLICPFAAIAVPTLLVWRFWPKPPKPGQCRCGYDLTANVSGVCPECGQPFEPTGDAP